MTIIAGRSLSLRCDARTSSSCKQLATFTGVLMVECRRAARDAGWMIRRTSCECGPCAEAKS